MTTTVNWQKSSFSGGGEGNDCLELATTGPRSIHLRESDDPTRILPVAPNALTALLRNVRNTRTRNPS